ncbi:BlaI/MecI/CopY family transcriptional regulator [candidate division KSB1 bacterium]|nr:BlaI/MecI/CopY family transcriptional regulator [candidate division KSB1 bacterium]
MSTTNSKLTPVEWEIMDAIWRIGASPSVRDVLEHAYPGGEKAYTTVQTIMNTLVKKDLLKTRKIGLVNFYTPVKTRNDIVKSEMKNMVSRVFNGSVPALANYLIDSEDLSLEEIQKIKELLNKREQQLKE